MAYKAEQIEKGPLKKMISQKQRKVLKKAKRKQMRNVDKESIPEDSKFEGWAI